MIRTTDLKFINMDRNVKKMIEDWDKVKCHICKKKISMLDAKLVDERYFVCKKDHR
jgi:hypothetical protein